tara:strand:- start:1514 stop:3865 length:2352 start_codon:yes stop_codon:yes gene_type:complete
MSFIKIDNSNSEYVTLQLNPSVNVISSSNGGGITGSNFVSAFKSKTLKAFSGQVFDLNGDGIIGYYEGMAEPKYRQYVMQTKGNTSGTTNFKSDVSLYMDSVTSAPVIAKQNKTVDVFRFDQPVTFNKNRNIKNVLTKNLIPYHQHRYDSLGLYYSNYNTLNFLDTDTLASGSALLYPNVSQSYDLPNSFSVNFWINPRYSEPGEYRAGTILHLSSSLAISLVSGSNKDEFDGPRDFKILLQLSQSANRTPSDVTLTAPSSGYPNDLIFTSSHTLNKNHWHHVCVQWSQNVRNGFGSIFIDDNETRFYVPSASLAAPDGLSPSALIVGNYFDGALSTLGSYLNVTKARAQGFTSMVAGEGVTDPTPTIRSWAHPLNAEVHEIKIYDKYLSNPETLNETERQAARNRGPSNFNNLKFYVPPFFYPTSSLRDVHISPFQTIRSSTDDPFNVAFSFGINGKLINLENFTREFIVGQQPRLYGLVPTSIISTVQNITADQFIYDTGSHKKRNFTILPNDNGQFTPDYFALSSSPMSESAKFYIDSAFKKGTPDYSIISLENLVPTSSIYSGLTISSGSMFDAVVSSSAQNPGVNRSAPLTIAQRTRDLSSNEVVIYDISNLYYGNRINPESFSIYEKDLTGSDGKIKIRLRDNGRGSLYRADALTSHAKWNSVGNILYDEGIAMVKSPHLFYFSKDETNLTFKGEQNLHTMVFNIPAYKELFNSSSNPTYVSVAPTTGANDEDLSTLYITTVNIHDENLNIIMKANFAQPIFKTEEDEFVIRLKEDF